MRHPSPCLAPGYGVDRYSAFKKIINPIVPKNKFSQFVILVVSFVFEGMSLVQPDFYISFQNMTVVSIKALVSEVAFLFQRTKK